MCPYHMTTLSSYVDKVTERVSKTKQSAHHSAPRDECSLHYLPLISRGGFKYGASISTLRIYRADNRPNGGIRVLNREAYLLIFKIKTH